MQSNKAELTKVGGFLFGVTHVTNFYCFLFLAVNDTWLLFFSEHPSWLKLCLVGMSFINSWSGIQLARNGWVLLCSAFLLSSSLQCIGAPPCLFLITSFCLQKTLRVYICWTFARLCKAGTCQLLLCSHFACAESAKAIWLHVRPKRMLWISALVSWLSCADVACAHALIT